MEENNTQITEQPTPKKVSYVKKHYFGLTILLVSLLSIALVSAAAIYLFSFPITVHVLEPIFPGTTSLSIEGYAGHEVTTNISIENKGTSNVDVCLSVQWPGEALDEILDIDVYPGIHNYEIHIQIPDEMLPEHDYIVNASIWRGPCSVV